MHVRNAVIAKRKTVVVLIVVATTTTITTAVIAAATGMTTTTSSAVAVLAAPRALPQTAAGSHAYVRVTVPRSGANVVEVTDTREELRALECAPFESVGFRLLSFWEIAGVRGLMHTSRHSVTPQHAAADGIITTPCCV